MQQYHTAATATITRNTAYIAYCLRVACLLQPSDWSTGEKMRKLVFKIRCESEDFGVARRCGHRVDRPPAPAKKNRIGAAV